MRWRRGNPDPIALNEELAAALLSGYSNMDRYREFRRLFLGSEEGKRVLHQILSWGGFYRSSWGGASNPEFNPYRAALCDGEKNLALKILSAMNAEPSQLPTAQTRKDENV